MVGTESIVWTAWPRLQRLALSNPHFQNALRSSDKLTTLVVARSDGLEEGIKDLRRPLASSSTVILVDAAGIGHGLHSAWPEHNDRAARVVDVSVTSDL